MLRKRRLSERIDRIETQVQTLIETVFSIAPDDDELPDEGDPMEKYISSRNFRKDEEKICEKLGIDENGMPLKMFCKRCGQRSDLPVEKEPASVHINALKMMMSSIMLKYPNPPAPIRREHAFLSGALDNMQEFIEHDEVYDDN